MLPALSRRFVLVGAVLLPLLGRRVVRAGPPPPASPADPLPS
jgi:hypothetical protein